MGIDFLVNVGLPRWNWKMGLAKLEQAHYLDQLSITMGPFHDYKLMIYLFECSIRKSQFDSSVFKLVVFAELQYRSDRLDIFTS